MGTPQARGGALLDSVSCCGGLRRDGPGEVKGGEGDARSLGPRAFRFPFSSGITRRPALSSSGFPGGVPKVAPNCLKTM